MKLLIGSTGLIGTTLKDSITFDYEFNSKNINDLIDLELTDSTDVYLSCLPATKYLVNQNPTADLDNILKIIDILIVFKNEMVRSVNYILIEDLEKLILIYLLIDLNFLLTALQKSYFEK